MLKSIRASGDGGPRFSRPTPTQQGAHTLRPCLIARSPAPRRTVPMPPTPPFDKSVFGEVKAYDFGPQHPDSVPAGSVDLVLVARAFHNWARQGKATQVYLRAFFAMLKPGGVLAVEQHRAPEGADPRAGTGYVPESYVIEEARKAGFVLEAKSEINANPKDTRDHPFGVWTLPPTRRSAPAGQPADPNFDHAKYDAIGEADRMTLRFRKPD